tara:strand:- start:846 stop:1070 length:225 start_codon:yes stop_codon:yes gene_type:complete
MTMKPKLGKLYHVQNDKPKFGANRSYKFVRVRDNWGVEMKLLFTDRQISEAEKRAAKNPEDIVRKVTFRDWIRK